MTLRKRRLGVLCLLAVSAVAALSLILARSGHADEAADVAAVPLLDDLKRSEAPLSGAGAWAALQWANGTNRTGTATTEGWRSLDAFPAIDGAYWTPSQFSGDGAGDAVSITMQAGPGSKERYVAVWLNMPEPSKAKSGYQLSWTAEGEAGKYEIAISRFNVGTRTLLVTKGGVGIAAGTTMALSYNDGLINAWSGPGSTLQSILTAADTTYSSGYVGLEASGNISRSSSFHGGQLPKAAAGECASGTRLFGGACWKQEASISKVTAPQAAVACGEEGGALPSTLALAAFAKQAGVALSKEGEWADDSTNYSGPNLYAAITVNNNAEVLSAVSTALRPYRCVYPVVR